MGQWLNSQDRIRLCAAIPHGPDQVREPHDNDLLHRSLRLAREAGPISLLLASGYTRQSVDDRYDAIVGAEVYGLPDPRRLDDDRTFKVWDDMNCAPTANWAASAGWRGCLASWPRAGRCVR